MFHLLAAAFLSSSPVINPSEVALAPQCGLATYYNEGEYTANEEPFDPSGLTAAHPDLPFNSIVKVVNQDTGDSVIVRINDRGGFGELGVMIDLTEEAFSQIALLDQGKVKVCLEILS